MLNKKKAQLWVKVVAWFLAISFGLGMTLLFALPNQPTKTVSTPRPSSTATNRTLTEAEKIRAAKSLVDQGDLALKKEQTDQAVSFYEQALTLNDGDDAIKSKLGDVYIEVGKQATGNDTTAAKDAYGKYLKILPDGPKAESAKAALADLD